MPRDRESECVCVCVCVCHSTAACNTHTHDRGLPARRLRWKGQAPCRSSEVSPADMRIIAGVGDSGGKEESDLIDISQSELDMYVNYQPLMLLPDFDSE